MFFLRWPHSLFLEPSMKKIITLAVLAGIHGSVQAAPITIDFTGSVQFMPDGACSVCAHIFTDFTRDTGLSASGFSTIKASFTIEQDSTPYPYGGAPGLYGNAITSASLSIGNLTLTVAPESTGFYDAAYGGDQAINMANANTLSVSTTAENGRWWEYQRLGTDYLNSPVNSKLAYSWSSFGLYLVGYASTLFGSFDLNDFASQVDAIDVSSLSTKYFNAGIEFYDLTYPYATDSTGDTLYYNYRPGLSLRGTLTDISVRTQSNGGSGNSTDAVIPEPGSLALLSLGLGGLIASRRRKRS
jgi:hypothetical protein